VFIYFVLEGEVDYTEVCFTIIFHLSTFVLTYRLETVQLSDCIGKVRAHASIWLVNTDTIYFSGRRCNHNVNTAPIDKPITPIP
jgi:hypothetical protein